AVLHKAIANPPFLALSHLHGGLYCRVQRTLVTLHHCLDFALKSLLTKLLDEVCTSIRLLRRKSVVLLLEIHSSHQFLKLSIRKSVSSATTNSLLKMLSLG